MENIKELLNQYGGLEGAKKALEEAAREDALKVIAPLVHKVQQALKNSPFEKIVITEHSVDYDPVSSGSSRELGQLFDRLASPEEKRKMRALETNSKRYVYKVKIVGIHGYTYNKGTRKWEKTG